jgi:hypothetical protein
MSFGISILSQMPFYQLLKEIPFLSGGYSLVWTDEEISGDGVEGPTCGLDRMPF